MPFPPEELKKLAHELAGLLQERGKRLCVAETACGGLISACILSYPGASKIYAGGVTIYTLPSRIAIAGWTDDDIKAYNGPTPEVVTKLADNVRSKLEADYCLCESGTAGPTASGASRNRTPGYCALALSASTGTTTKECDTQSSDRAANMVAFAKAALELAIEGVKQ